MFIQLAKQDDLEKTVAQFFNNILKTDQVDYLMLPQTNEFGKLPMPTLISSDSHGQHISLMPVLPFNSARSAIKLLKHHTDAKIALFLRPCEIRSLIELSKLNQCQLDNAIIISTVCGGRMENKTYLKLSRETELNIEETLNNNFEAQHTCQSCQTCDDIQPNYADLVVHFDTTHKEPQLYIEATTDQGKKILSPFDQLLSEKPEKPYFGWIEKKQADKKALKDELYAKTASKIASMPQFQSIIANCLNCYNCMSACPACYCKECVFKTDVFNHDPENYFRKAHKKECLKMPTDTSMFHLTRLSHMSHSCVGCGQCSSVCPSDIPIADFFRTIAHQTQSLFNYKPGRDKQEPLPYQVFEENSCNCKDH